MRSDFFFSSEKEGLSSTQVLSMKIQLLKMQNTVIEKQFKI